MIACIRRALLIAVFAAAYGLAASFSAAPGARGMGLRASGRELRLALTQALERLPGSDVGKDNHPGNALNVVFVASERRLESALGEAGWKRVPLSLFRSFADGINELGRGRWPAAFPPMDSYTLFGRDEDLNFSIPAGFPFARHHFRLWKSPFTDEKGRPIWWAAADYDRAIRWRDLSHVTDPNIDRERDFLASTLRGLAKKLSWVALPQVPRGGADDRGYAWKGDGRVLLAVF